MNTQLLRRIEKHILEEPKRFVMSEWIMTADSVEDNRFDQELGKYVPFPACSTVACIGGWGAILKRVGTVKDAAKFAAKIRKMGLEYRYKYLDKEGAKALGLKGDEDDESSEVARLFYVQGWPVFYRDRWNKASTPEERAKVAVDRIEYFIRTKGTDRIRRN